MSNADTSQDSKRQVLDQYGMTPDDWKRLDAKTDEEIAVEAASDPDCPPPMTPEQLSRMRQVSLAKLVRQKLRLSPEHFAETYGIPLETLKAWERHEAEPSPVEEAYLRLIEREPDRAQLTHA
jgi:putative transcriptional regulator